MTSSRLPSNAPGAARRAGRAAARVCVAAGWLAALCGAWAGRPGAASAGEGVAHRLDALLREAWRAEEITPAPICADHEFLRRVTLDLAGRAPRLDEIESFRRNPDRAAKVDALLASPEFAHHWSEVWTSLLVGHVDDGADREALRVWLERRCRENTPHDRLAAELISASGSAAFNGAVHYLLAHAEEPAVSVSRVFLGVRLDCARCHDHPFDRWKQADLELFGRFFNGMERRDEEGSTRLVDAADTREASAADKPRFLTGAQPRTGQWRAELALFITRSKPFARAYVNRLWHQLLGRGLVHPVDDFNRENPPSVPAALEHLADAARTGGFDTRALVRMICASQAYQLSSTGGGQSPRAEALFARRALKPLTAEQLHDSLAAALELKPTRESRRAFVREFVGESTRDEFGDPWRYRETTQALMARLARDLPPPARDVEELYWRVLCRPPSERERALCADRPPQDVLFALAHSNEFFFNH